MSHGRPLRETLRSDALHTARLHGHARCNCYKAAQSQGLADDGAVSQVLRSFPWPDVLNLPFKF